MAKVKFKIETHRQKVFSHIIAITPEGHHLSVAYEDKPKDGTGVGAGGEYRAYFAIDEKGKVIYLPRYKKTLDRLFSKLEAK